MVVRRWQDLGPITPLGPDFPRNGGYSAPVLTGPKFHVSVPIWGHHVSKPPSCALHPGHEFFNTSADGGTNWPKHPVEVDPGAGSIALPMWWGDGDLGRGQGGNLYATWDTQTPAGDIGWLSFSTDGGKIWSHPARVTPDHDKAVHIVEVLGGQPRHRLRRPADRRSRGGLRDLPAHLLHHQGLSGPAYAGLHQVRQPQDLARRRLRHRIPDR